MEIIHVTVSETNSGHEACVGFEKPTMDTRLVSGSKKNGNEAFVAFMKSTMGIILVTVSRNNNGHVACVGFENPTMDMRLVSGSKKPTTAMRPVTGSRNQQWIVAWVGF